MKVTRYLCLLLALLFAASMQAQFNPANPPEPGGNVKTYKLTLKALPGVGGSVSGSGTYEPGRSVRVSASVASGYVFDGWEDADGKRISASTSFYYSMPEADATLTARFTYSPANPSEPQTPPVYRKVSVDINPKGAGACSGTGSYQVGASVQLTASTNTGYRFVNYTRDGEVISTSSRFRYVVSDGDNRLVANYVYDPTSPGEPQPVKPTHRLYLKVNPTGAGSISVSSGNSYAEGSSVSLNTSPNSGYVFTSWTDADGNTVSNSRSFSYKMPSANSTLTANYVYSPGSPTEPGTVNPRRNVIYGSRQSVKPATEVFYDVALENTDEISGISVDITMPEGYQADYSRAVLTQRAGAHTISSQSVEGNTRRIFVRGSEALSGGSGAVFRIPVVIPASAEPGTSVSVPMSKGVVFKTDGSQNPVDAMDGIIKIAEEEITLPDSPDFIVRDVETDEADIMPGSTVEVRWKVSNEGTVDAHAGWSETVWLTDENGKRSVLGTLYHETDRLAVKESVSRSATFTIPALPGIDGRLNVMVSLTPYASAGEIEEFQVNNSATGTGLPLNLGKVLVLEMPDALTEGTDGQVRCRLSRSGSWLESETFTIARTAGDSRLRLPECITIPRDQSGAYFMAGVNDNDELDESADFAISISGNGYPAIEKSLQIIDDEYPAIELTLSGESISEGESATLTVTLPRAPEADVTISLSTDAPERFELPAAVVVRKGTVSATAVVKAIDNNSIENMADVTFYAKAPHYGNGEAFVFLYDNDMPLLELALAPAEVSEGAGPRAIRGTLRRLTNTDSRITVVFSDDLANTLVYEKRIIMDKGVAETDFNIGVIDNTRVDGDRAVNLTAAVYIQTCGCSAAGESGGSVSAGITVIDNDGPSLALKSSNATLRRDSRSTELTVERNTATDAPLTVKFVSDPEGLLSMPESVVIAAGATSARINVEAPAESFTGVEKAITVNAVCDGFAKGTTLILLSDRTLPDAVISISADTSEDFIPGMPLTIHATVGNEGNAPMPDAVPVDLYMAGSGERIATGHTTRTLAPGDSEIVDISFDVPIVPGAYSVSAHVNDASNFSELTRTNNTSQTIDFRVKSPFTAGIEVDRKALLPGEKVKVTGAVPGYRSELELYYITAGARRTMTVMPDADSRFAVEIDPLYAGDYIVGVCVPGEKKSTEMASFAVQGFRIDGGSYTTCDISSGESRKISMTLSNSSSLPLSGLTIEATGVPAECKVDIAPIGAIPGNGSVTVDMTLTALGVTPGDDWSEFTVKATTAEGAEGAKSIFFYSRPNRASLVASVSAINTTMTMGLQRVYRFTIANNGKGDSGDISLSLPSFMQKGTATTLPSLAFGEMANVDIVLTPSTDMQLNVPVQGRLGVNCTNGSGIAIPFSIEPVSELTGRLVVDVKDEYTFYTDEAPHVEGADIIVSHPVTGKMIAHGKSDASGLWDVTLPEGFYTLEVSASRHESWSGTIQIAPGTDNDTPVFLPFNAITYDWKVEETTVDDSYDIVTTVEYETRVPKPVVVVDFPKLSYRNQIAYISITNKGLLSATNVEVLLPEPTDEIQMQVIGDALIPELRAGENRMVPVRVTVDEDDKYPDFRMTVSSYSFTGTVADENTSARAPRLARAGSGCCKVTERVQMDDTECDPVTGERHPNGKKKTVECSYYTGDCGHPGSWPPGAHVTEAPWFPGTPGSLPGTRPGTRPDPGRPSTEKTSLFWQEQVRNSLVNGCLTNCEKALAEALANCGLAAAGCAGGPVGTIIACGGGLALNCNPGHVQDVSTSVDCMLAGAGCIPGPAGCAAGIIGCLKSAYDAFQACMKANRRYHGNRVAAMAAPEENNDAVQQRIDVLMMYIDYFNAVNDNLSNLMGEAGWDRMVSDELKEMMEYLRSVRTDDGYFPTDDSVLKGKPASVDLATYLNFIERFNNTIEYTKTGQTAENMLDLEVFDRNTATLTEINSKIDSLGFPSFEAFANAAFEEMEHLDKLSAEPSAGVCASITLKFRQTMVMTRQAFRGTLTITNGNEEVPMSDIKLQVKIRDKEGNLVGEREFAVMAESIDGFEGNTALDAGWTLAAKGTGEATVMFIPSKYAAPVEPLVYSFGGALSYTDPFTGSTVTRELSPIEMTVSPSPVLDLDYFMQRDVLGDDPLTENRIEASEPAEFALLISNKGFGDANNLRMTTAQPEIVDNRKGLAINFEIVGSSLNGRAATMAIGERIPTEFGTLKASSSAYAQWWMKSSLLGHFTSYNVEATQVSAYGSEDMSLLDRVEIHELIHGFTPEDGTEGSRAFLVNDIEDAEGLPDMIWFSETADVAEVAQSASAEISDFDGETCLLTVTAADAGWTYGKTDTPWTGRRRIVKAVRQSDGKELPTDNFWTTFVTLANSAAPVYEDKLHFAASLASTSESYLLTLEPKPDPELAVVGFDGIPDENEVKPTPLTKPAVRFNKPIDESTFDSADITLICQGEKLPVTKAVITPAPLDNAPYRYELDLSAYTTASGYYTLTVDATGITDTEGYSGSECGRTSWIQLADGKIIVSAIAVPAEGGQVSPAAADVDFGSVVELTAEPAEGYEFVKWTLGNDILSTEPRFSFSPVEDAVVNAVFALKLYDLTIDNNPELCAVHGGASGIYAHGTRLTLVAEPASGNVFLHWENSAGESVSTDPLLEWTVKADETLRPVTRLVSTGVATVGSSGVHRIYPVPTRSRLHIDGDFAELLSIAIVSADGSTTRIIKGYTAGTPINVEALPAGLYLVRIVTDRGISVHRMVKL